MAKERKILSRREICHKGMGTVAFVELSKGIDVIKEKLISMEDFEKLSDDEKQKYLSLYSNGTGKIEDVFLYNAIENGVGLEISR